MSEGDARATVPGSIGRLDSLLQHRARLGACVLLSTADQLSFSRLKDLLDETDGNLGAQMRKLEDAGYVAMVKAHSGRRPVTWYSLSPTGRAALGRHLDAMASIVAAAHGRDPPGGA